MIYAIANEFFLDTLKLTLPLKVEDTIRDTLDIYKEYYDTSIPFQSGGYIILVTENAEYHQLLLQYNISSEMAEFTEIVAENELGIWKQEYYQLATEYGISIIFYEPKEK